MPITSSFLFKVVQSFVVRTLVGLHFLAGAMLPVVMAERPSTHLPRVVRNTLMVKKFLVTVFSGYRRRLQSVKHMPNKPTKSSRLRTQPTLVLNEHTVP